MATKESGLEEAFRNIESVREMIVAFVVAMVEEGAVTETETVRGSVDCPVCTRGRVEFAADGVTGNVRAKCSSEGCVSWIE